MHYLGDKIKCENPRLTSSPRYFLNQVLLKRIYNRHYIAKTQEELQDIVNRLVDTGRKYGMEINNLYMGQRVKLRPNQGKSTMIRLEKESDRDVARHPYYLTYMKNI